MSHNVGRMVTVPSTRIGPDGPLAPVSQGVWEFSFTPQPALAGGTPRFVVLHLTAVDLPGSSRVEVELGYGQDVFTPGAPADVWTRPADPASGPVVVRYVAAGTTGGVTLAEYGSGEPWTTTYPTTPYDRSWQNSVTNADLFLHTDPYVEPTFQVLALRPQRLRQNNYSNQLYPGAGRRLELVNTARRAAWASAAFALRVRAGVTLDVEARELAAGLRLLAHGGVFYPEIFLADVLENGAGFVTFLAEQGRFGQLVEDTIALVREWDVDHECDASCPSCLRDWSNLPYHPWLDWRLAADTLEIVVHGAPSVDRWVDTRANAIAAVARDFDWQLVGRGVHPVLQDEHGDLITIVHPLSIDASSDTPIPTSHGTALPFDLFNFDRRPGEVVRRR